VKATLHVGEVHIYRICGCFYLTLSEKNGRPRWRAHVPTSATGQLCIKSCTFKSCVHVSMCFSCSDVRDWNTHQVWQSWSFNLHIRLGWDVRCFSLTVLFKYGENRSWRTVLSVPYLVSCRARMRWVIVCTLTIWASWNWSPQLMLKCKDVCLWMWCFFVPTLNRKPQSIQSKWNWNRNV